MILNNMTILKVTIIQMILIFLLAPVVWNIQLIELELIRHVTQKNQITETLAIQQMDGTMESHIKVNILDFPEYRRL